MMLASFLAGTAYMHSFTMQAAWDVLPSFHFSLWSLTLNFYWSTSTLPVYKKVFQAIHLRKKTLHAWMSLNNQAQDWLPQTLPNTPIQFGSPQYLACTSGSGSLWVTVDLLEAMGEHHWRGEVPLSSCSCGFPGYGSSSPLSTKHLGLFSQTGPGSHLFRNAKQTKADQTWEGCKAGPWEGKRLPTV